MAQPIRRVIHIPAPSMAVVSPTPRSVINALNDKAAEQGRTTGTMVTHEEHEARIQASKPARKGKGASKASGKPAAVTPDTIKAEPKASEPAKPVMDPILQAVSNGTMAPGEAAIKLAAREGLVSDPDLAITAWRLSQTLPVGVVVDDHLKALARARGGILQGRVERVRSNPFADQLRQEIAKGQMTVDQARSQFVRTVTVKDPLLGKIQVPVPVGGQVSERVIVPEALVSAQLTGEEKEGTIISVSFAMLRRGASEEERVQAALRGAIRHGKASSNPVSWTFDAAYLAWETSGLLPEGIIIPDADIEVEAQKMGPAGKMLSWAVGFLSANADCQRVTFEQGTVLTVFYQDPTSDPKVRALLGDPNGDGPAIRRFWVGDTKDESAQIRAMAKGHKLLSDGLKVGTLKLKPGTDAAAVSWPRALKPGQYTLPGTVEEKVLDSSGNPTGETIPVPAVFLMQRITSFKVDHVLRHEAIRAEERGEALPNVENTLSATGKRGAAVCKVVNYDRQTTWQKGFATTHVTFSRG